MTDETTTPLTPPTTEEMNEFEASIRAAAQFSIRELGPKDAYEEARYLVGQVVFARFLLTEKLGMEAEDTYGPIADTLIAINEGGPDVPEGSLNRTAVMFGYYTAEKVMDILTDELGYSPTATTPSDDGFGMYL